MNIDNHCDICGRRIGGDSGNYANLTERGFICLSCFGKNTGEVRCA